MSKISIYSILDVKSNCYGPLISFANDATAIRAFQEMIISGDRDSMLALYPTDYILCCIGFYDNEFGTIESTPAPMHIMTGLDAATAAIQQSDRRRALRARLDGVKDLSDDVKKMVKDVIDVKEQQERADLAAGYLNPDVPVD